MPRLQLLAASSAVLALTTGLLSFSAVPATAAEQDQGGSISGTVTSSVGGRLTQPVVVYARLDAGSPDARRMAYADDLTGKYTITGLPAGDYIVEFYPVVTNIFFPQYEGQLYDGVQAESEATVLHVKAGGAIRGVNASMEYEDGADAYDPAAALPCTNPRDPASRKAFRDEFELRFGTVKNVTETNLRSYIARCGR